MDWPAGFSILVTGTSTSRGGRAIKAEGTLHIALGLDVVSIAWHDAPVASPRPPAAQPISANSIDIAAGRIAIRYLDVTRLEASSNCSSEKLAAAGRRPGNGTGANCRSTLSRLANEPAPFNLRRVWVISTTNPSLGILSPRAV